MGFLSLLAEEALAEARKLDAYLDSQNRPSTSFDEDTLTALPLELVTARNTLIDRTHTLKQLALGPVGVLTEIMWACTDFISLSTISSFDIATHVPSTPNSSISFHTLASRSQLSPTLLERFVRHAMSSHIFAEPVPGEVAHTASSRLLNNPDLRDTIAMMAQETWQPVSKVAEVVRERPKAEEPEEAAFASVNGGRSMFDVLQEEPERARKFGGAMRWYGTFDSWSLAHLINGFNWTEFDKPGATIVDVGGGIGSASLALARTTAHAKFIVQDLAVVVEEGRRELADSEMEVRERIHFAVHDFFTEQTFRGAQVYFFRWILHDWSDKYAVRILKGLVPAMTEGAAVVLFEWLLAEGPETRCTEKQARNTDLVMLTQFNGRERTKAAFETIFHKADARFQLVDVRRPAGSAMTVLEWRWRAYKDT